MKIQGIQGSFLKEKKQVFFDFHHKSNHTFLIPEEHSDLLQDALSTLSSKHLTSQFFSKLTFHILDQIENSWNIQIDSVSKTLHIHKNNTKYTCDGQINTLLEMIWEKGPYDDASFQFEKIPTYYIHLKNDEIEFTIEEDQIKINSVKKLQEKERKLLEYNWFQKLKDIQPKASDIAAAAMELYPISIEYKALAKRYQGQQFQQDAPQYSLGYLFNLKNQIYLIEEIEEKLKTLEPLVEKYYEYDHILSNIDTKIKSQSVELSYSEVPKDEWKKMIDEFFSKEKCLQETKIFQAVSSRLHQTVIPLFKEIEDKLFEYDQTQSQKWIPIFQGGKHESEVQTLRSILEYKDQILKILNQLEGERTTLEKESQLRWQRVSSSKKIPLDVSFEDLIQKFHDQLNFLNFCIEKERIFQQKKLIEDKSHDFAQLLKRWQFVSGSQKSLSFDSPASLISEAKNICRYKKEKETSCEFLEKNFVDMVGKQSKKDILEQHALELQKKWKAVWSKYGWPSLKIQESFSLLEEAIQYDRVSRFFDQHKNQENPFQKGSPVFPFIFWKISDIEHDLSLRESMEDLSQFFFQKEKHPSHNFFIEDDESRKMMLDQYGFGKVSMKFVESEEKNSQKSQENLPQKTKDLLKILNGQF